jgi:hypothetical protein
LYEQPLFAEEEVLDETCTGNFRSVVHLLAKYDAPLTNHLRAVRNSKLKRKRKPIVKMKGKKSRSGRGNLVSFMNADSQNKIINSIVLPWIALPTVPMQINCRLLS